MSDIETLKADLADAEAAKALLVDERRANRATMSPTAFRAYNEETRDQQIDVQADLQTATDAITAHLNNARQEIMVGTLSETNTPGGAS